MAFKVVLVDDENLIRTSLSELINQSPRFEVIAACQNGQEGLEAIVNYHPEIVITDVQMPVMDGLTLISKCRELNITSQFIILSGHGDFEYARSGMRLGTLDYVLKPVEYQNLMYILDKAAKVIENERQDCEQLKNQAGLLCLQNLKTDITRNWLRKSNISLQAPQVVAVNLRIPYHEEIFNQIKNEIEPFLDQSLKGHYLGLVYKKMILLIINRTIINQDSLVTLCKELRAFLKKNLNINALIGLGKNGGSLSYIATSYLQAISALSESLYHVSQGIYFFNPERQVADDVESFYAQAKECLCNAILDCNHDEANQIVDVFFGKAEAEKYPPAVLLAFGGDLCQFINKNISGNNPDTLPDYSELNSLLIRNLTLNTLKEEIKFIIQRGMERSNHMLFKRYGSVIYQIIKYIHAHYQEELNEEKIGEHFYITVNYFTKLFKAKTGVSFTKYVTDYRIKKAKELLRHENLSINEIAGLVGCNNPRYFAKVFKDSAGLTPTEYRNNFG